MLRENELSKIEIQLTANPKVQGLNIKNYYDMNKDEINRNFINIFKKVFRKAYELQQEGKKSDISYIVVSVIKVAIIDDRYEARIDLYDKTYCMDSIECSINWDVSFIFKFIENEIEDFIKKNPISLKHLKSYERNYLKFKCLPSYANILKTYLKINISKVLELDEFQKLLIESKIKVLFGQYLDEVNFVASISKKEVDYGILSNSTGSGI